MECEYCEIINGKGRAEVLYEDNDVAIAVKDKVFTPGQITIFPKKHYTILEMVPSRVLEKCVAFANKTSKAVFAGMGSQGTNIIIQNGLGAGQSVPHFGIEVVPRREGDAVNLQWESRQLAEDEVEMTFSRLKKEVPDIVKRGLKGEETVEAIEEDQEERSTKDSYLLKSLRRIP
ncbi:hypothetical protein COV20_01980 [Candidatus Woesearchaeota archaeon CG10_big_fil_rev_8_21_14_0_10_45_16]|nr:MAG: hypothetical protein COV20_01980 [Candidatus Woesearchaeota archaeon CG10_big_fil_rev_8_21_14_0_10_45_16]